MFEPRLHVDDWLDMPPADEAERWAKEFLEYCRRPAIDQSDAWRREHRLFCSYGGKRYRCTGASRLGDVYLTRKFDRIFGYELRVWVEECSDWGREP
jgi:hypothetical protein